MSLQSVNLVKSNILLLNWTLASFNNYLTFLYLSNFLNLSDFVLISLFHFLYFSNFMIPFLHLDSPNWFLSSLFHGFGLFHLFFPIFTELWLKSYFWLLFQIGGGGDPSGRRVNLFAYGFISWGLFSHGILLCD